MRPIAQSGFVSSSVGGVLLLSNADGCWCRLCSDVLVLVDVVVVVVVLLLLLLGTAVVVAATVSNVASATLTDDVTTGAVLVAGLVSSTRLRTAHARSISIIRSTLTLPSLVLAAAMSFRRKSAMYAASMTTPASSVGGGGGLEGDAAVLVATVSPVALHLFLYSSIDSLRGCAGGGVVCGCDVCFWLKTKSIRFKPPDVVIVGGFLLKTISNSSSMAAVLPLSFNAFRIFVESMLLASSPAGVANVATAVMSGVVELTVAASACSVSATRFTGDDDGEWYFSRGLGGGDLDLYRR